MIRHALLAAAAPAALLALAALATACNGPTSTDRHVVNLPDPSTFAPVADMLGGHCGSLDCHGSISRAFRVYTVNGLRLDPKDYSGGLNPVTGDISTTTDAEKIATYYSFVGIEPELTAQVIREGGAHPERLTVIRKARGAENHKGGAAIHRNGTADTCFTSWLAGGRDSQLDMCTGEDSRIPIPDQ
jgi:hypothetical protein